MLRAILRGAQGVIRMSRRGPREAAVQVGSGSDTATRQVPHLLMTCARYPPCVDVSMFTMLLQSMLKLSLSCDRCWWRAPAASTARCTATPWPSACCPGERPPLNTLLAAPLESEPAAEVDRLFDIRLQTCLNSTCCWACATPQHHRRAFVAHTVPFRLRLQIAVGRGGARRPAWRRGRRWRAADSGRRGGAGGGRRRRGSGAGGARRRGRWTLAAHRQDFE